MTTATLAQSPVQPASVVFLDKTRAARAIIDETLSPYFSLMQPMEMSAKTGKPITGESLDQQRAECRKHYQAAVLDFTDSEQKGILEAVRRIHPTIASRYPRLGTMQWSFIKISGRIEGGMPFTLGVSILLPEAICRDVAQDQKISDTNVWTPIAHLLLHEQTHVFQRANPDAMDSLYTNVWGFQKASSIAGCNWLVTHHLANPDAVKCPWVFPLKKAPSTSYIWPLVVLAEGDHLKRMPADFRQLAITLDKTDTGFRVRTEADGRPFSTNLSRVREYRDIFPTASGIYHPNEASADIFARLVMWDDLASRKPALPAAAEKEALRLAPYKKWFAENMQLPAAPAP